GEKNKPNHKTNKTAGVRMTARIRTITTGTTTKTGPTGNTFRKITANIVISLATTDGNSNPTGIGATVIQTPIKIAETAITKTTTVITKTNTTRQQETSSL